ncbi:GntR family transcriptional regulator [Bradyrhizobium sp. NP1]|uniref:GntR family transcriptional regulator n=1 Tax=Bradyrhizobium sp. NP1 TaxID=3049772 RepID=UPI0025A50E9C|nr:GntR family transcriptional regulator [Bradyrhizobium sp. NP1]WJR77863.1 GntR family transcriptional regulator [Bradyrhizobium sp. NP1]
MTLFGEAMEMMGETPLVTASRATAVYREIKRRITDLQYKPGDKLSEAKLAAELGLGRSPVRTALSRLQSEGWIEISPQSGTFVRGLSEQEVGEILETRLVLEAYLAGLAATRIEEAELAKLGRAFDEFGESVSHDRLDEYLDLDLQFHLAVYKAAGNRLIANILVNLIDKVRWIRRASSGSPMRIQDALGEIRAVYQALCARDQAAASAAMRRHIANTIEFRR